MGETSCGSSNGLRASSVPWASVGPLGGFTQELSVEQRCARSDHSMTWRRTTRSSYSGNESASRPTHRSTIDPLVALSGAHDSCRSAVSCAWRAATARRAEARLANTPCYGLRNVTRSQLFHLKIVDLCEHAPVSRLRNDGQVCLLALPRRLSSSSIVGTACDRRTHEEDLGKRVTPVVLVHWSLMRQRPGTTGGNIILAWFARLGLRWHIKQPPRLWSITGSTRRAAGMQLIVEILRSRCDF